MAECIISLQNEFLKADISTLGATLKSVSDTDGKNFIWAGDERSWEGSAPILFPFCGGLNNDKFRYGAKEYTMGRHGYIRFKEFRVEEQSAHEVTLVSDSDSDTLQCYPFSYSFKANFKLCERSLITTYTVENKTESTMYFSVGAHEGYALRSDISNYSLTFDKNEDVPTYEFGTPIDSTSIRDVGSASVLTLCDSQFNDGLIAFSSIRSKEVSLACECKGHEIKVEFPDATFLSLWKIPGADFICIEPWNGSSDPEGYNGTLSEKEKIESIDAESSRSFTHTITFVK